MESLFEMRVLVSETLFLGAGNAWQFLVEINGCRCSLLIILCTETQDRIVACETAKFAIILGELVKLEVPFGCVYGIYVYCFCSFLRLLAIFWYFGLSVL